MKVSKEPVMFANRAEMIECNADSSHSVGLDMREKTICINTYSVDGTRVIVMGLQEAEDLAIRLTRAAAALGTGVIR